MEEEKKISKSKKQGFSKKMIPATYEYEDARIFTLKPKMKKQKIWRVRGMGNSFQQRTVDRIKNS